MENNMNLNDNNGNNKPENDHQYLIEALRLFPNLQNCTEEELQHLAAGIKEMALLLRQLENVIGISDQ